jgi:hypothetical protein
MKNNRIFKNDAALEKIKNKVWKQAVIPFVFRKNTNSYQKFLFWVAEHTLAGVSIGMLSIGMVGVLAWETTKNIQSYPNLTEVVFKNETKINNIKNIAKNQKTPIKGTFQPIIVESDDNTQPLETITSGKSQNPTVVKLDR